MASLLGILSIATGALGVEEGALNATSNNVANVNTPGYARQIPVLVESNPVVLGGLTYGTGVSLEKLQSIRDPILQLRIGEETQQQGQLNSYVASLQQVQTLFNSSNSDIGSQISKFFSSLSQLSTDPTSVPDRQSVLAAATSLASAFRNASANLSQQRSTLDLTVTQDVQQVNTLTSQISQVNAQITTLQNLGQDASTFIGQRDVLIGQLSGLVDVSQIQSDGNNLTLTTSNGTPLVVGSKSYQLTTQLDPSGVQHIFSQGRDITSTLTSGALQGLIQVRDQKIPTLLSSLDTLASGLANSLNTANRAGFDLNGTAGTNLFAPPSGTGQGYAGNISVQITDPSLVAASSDGSPGSNGNVAVLSAVQNQTIAGGQTPSDYYSNIVFGVGNDVSSGTAELGSAQAVLQQLQDQRGSLSGVSLDEEASHLVQYQNAYNAAAHVVTTVNDMLYTVINMGTLTG
jgi:flagellar hook-associated protein 1 FlgK